MGKTIIQVSCVDQTLRLKNSPKIASGGVGEDYLQVSFCSMWDGYAKVAVFFRDRDTVYPVALDDTNECLIPSVVLADPGRLKALGEAAAGLAAPDANERISREILELARPQD